MGKKITLSITVTEKMLKQAIKDAGLKIVDKAAFSKLFKEQHFADLLAEDMLGVWHQTNDDDCGDGLAILLGDCVDFAE